MYDLNYVIGEYVYNIIRPEITGDLEIFKYILGWHILNYVNSSQ
jgi:hypothetical protein